MAVKDGKEYVTFVAERFVRFMETPPEERRRRRREARSRREPFLARWFGWALYGFLMQRRARRAEKRAKAETTPQPAAGPRHPQHPQHR